MSWEIKHGDWIEVLRTMPEESVHCVVTSPPYWGLRDYGVPGQLGLERTPEEYVAKMVEGFREVRRVLRSDGTLWLNLGDSYSGSGRGGGGSYEAERRGWEQCPSGNGNRGVAGLNRVDSGDDSEQHYSKGIGLQAQPEHCSGMGALKPKDLCGIPWLVAFALRADGWYLRQDIIWAKPNPMPESVTDRCTKSHEYIFLLTKSARYFYDAEAIKEDSVTNDIRRPYGSEGAWQLDGRPDEQRHGGEPRCFKGSQFNTGKTAEHQLGRASEKPRKTKVPGGWDTGAGGHGTIHREGRTSAEYVDTPLGEKRNKRSVWNVTTSPFPEAHFATFPPKLVEPCILAGTSERGCCAACGAPRERITERTGYNGQRADDTVYTGQAFEHAQSAPRGPKSNFGEPEIKTIGWQPTCTCKADTVPCTVLDPFNGAGTTGLVSTRLGRHYIGIELNPQYVEMAERRIVNDAPLFNTLETHA